MGMARKSRLVPDMAGLRRFLSPRAGAAALAVVAGSDEQELWKHFSLVEGGPLYRLGRALGLTGGASGLMRIGLALAFFTWLPLAALTLIPHDMPPGPLLPFILSFGTHARLLAAIPLLFVAEAVFDARIRQEAADKTAVATNRTRRLRDAVVWREILGPPVSLRDSEER